MGIFKSMFTATSETMKEQWKEFFYCNSLSNNTLILRAQRQHGEKSGNEGSENIISDGSIIDVADGMCAIAIENGKVIAVYDTPGEHVFESEKTASVFNGASMKKIGKSILDRVGYGGDIPIDQKIYYVNTKEIPDNPFAADEGVLFRFVDENTGVDIDGYLQAQGVFSFKITDPEKFYKIAHIKSLGETGKDTIARMLSKELVANLQSALSGLFESGLRPSDVAKYTDRLSEELNRNMQDKWSGLRGLSIVSIAFSSFTVYDSTMRIITKFQDTRVLTDPQMAAASLVCAATEALPAAAQNSAATAVTEVFVNSPVPADEHLSEWTCSCGAVSRGKFCPQCGKKRPNIWKCDCGTVNTGNFCSECGKKAPPYQP